MALSTGGEIGGSLSIVASTGSECAVSVPVPVKGNHAAGGKKDEAIDELPAAIVRGQSHKNWISHPSRAAIDSLIRTL